MAKNELRMGILSGFPLGIRLRSLLRNLLCGLLCILTGGALRGQDGPGVDTLIRDGRSKAEKNEFRAALGPLTAALMKDPANFEALRWRGHCRSALGQHVEAILDFDAALEVDQKNDWVWYARGMAKHYLKRPVAAIADFTVAIRLNPTNHKAVEWRGFNKNLIGDHLGAYLDLTAALQLDPENPWVFHARGRAAVALGAYPQAKDDFTSEQLLDPKSAESHAQLGFVHVAEGDHKAALESFDRAIAIDPNRLEYARLWRYWLAIRAGRMNERDNALPIKGWTGELAKALLGQHTKSQLLLRLSSYGVEPEELDARRCEAAFYLGLRALIVGRPNRAREHFKNALVHGDATMPEWRAARHLSQRR